MIRGEYWIKDGHCSFADGDVSDTNHMAEALQAIRQEILEALGWSYECYGLCDSSVFQETLETVIGASSLQAVRDALREKGITHLDGFLSAAFEQEDAREAAMRELGWKWLKKDWVATQHLEREDLEDIAAGVETILDEEGVEVTPGEEIEIRVASTGESVWVEYSKLIDRDFGHLTPGSTAVYAPEPGFGVAITLDRQAQLPCYKTTGD